MVASRRAPDPGEVRDALAAVTAWLDGQAGKPARAELATAVRLTLRALQHRAPGSSVEVRVPPFAAVQCIAGPQHTRGNPPNVVEADPRTWLELACGRMRWAEAVDGGRISVSGTRADLSDWLPVD
ncbi:sterol carrier family protein [Haloechinothrix sp. LS1_15]|uniref:sterol carrier family protein n=1 Tax=Haloechinothrix sp. LS1_15 TaxID=2652248 RepID=UPI0029448AE3|nr:sterol carrier family protein [Haloechinothrix sp. LS1_15]MDV6011214.1 hypothetical protein [Haloechinothrix sp. LS1_15]